MLDNKFLNHPIFLQLPKLAEFYEHLSFNVMGFIPLGTMSIINIDSYIYTSIQGTLDSIHTILLKGRINDGYALLRKYYDATIINTYISLYLEENFSIDNFVVTKIDNWIKGKEHLPEYRIMNDFINKSKKVEKINTILKKDQRYKFLRNRCNDHTHYNHYLNVLYNDNQIYLENRTKYLDRFCEDLQNIFISHFAYTFWINDHYMMSSDYVDCLDCGIEPELDSQYWVVPFVQEIFDSVIKINRMDLADEILKNTCMVLR